ncbi:MAG: alpha/beta fold hydrolase [Chloroflexota bacterium]
MIDPTRILFIHGSESSSQTYKAGLLREQFPGMLTPDFTGTLDARLAQLEGIIADTTGWTLVGSSLGGLMAAIFAARHPGQVRKLVLLAPALVLPEFEPYAGGQIPVPAVVIHGSRDDVVPPGPVLELARKVFPKLTYITVDDDHRLHKTAGELDWKSILE